jgi:hypothetical protein
MHAQPAIETARKMIRLHGLRAQAIAAAHTAELRLQGDTAAMDHWQQIQVAISELRPAMLAPNEAAR